MATDTDVTKLNKYVKRLDKFLRDQLLWEKQVKNNLRRLNSKVFTGVGPGPNITDPPPPPRKP